MRMVLGVVGLLLVAGCSSPAAPVASPTATTVAAGRTADQIVQTFKAKGLPVGEVAVYTAETDPNKILGRPNGYTSKANFRDTRIAPSNPPTPTIEVSSGGSVEIWPTIEGAKARSDVLQAAGKSFAPLIEYNYLDGPVLLRISKDLTPDQAAEYEKALK